MNLELAISLPGNFLSWESLLFLIGSFIYGSIPFTYAFTFLFKKKKLDKTGTGNIGVANAFGVGGLPAGFLTVAGEASKGILPILVSHLFFAGSLITSLILITVGIIGNGTSFFLRGKGGQGGTILMWALLVLSPYTLLLYLFFTGITYIILRRRRLANSLGYILLPIEILFIEQNLLFVIFGAFMATYYILRYQTKQSDYEYYRSQMRFLRFIEKTFREKSSILVSISDVHTDSDVGFKAYSLKILKKNRVRVSRAYVCPFSVFRRYRKNDPKVLIDLKSELRLVLKENTSYSVRSSANLEDSEAHSFAGQFKTFLDVKTIEDVQEAIIAVWDLMESEHIKAYLARIGKRIEDLQMAVIIQEMVESRFSGVVFTKNPVTGFDEIILEAVSGPGNRLYDPMTKLERWVYKWGHWLEKPDNPDISEEIIKKVVLEARQIALRYGNAVDLEWAYDDGKVWWLQLRPITSLRGVNIYSNKISKEFLPGMIKPLVWSINIPVVNGAWKKLLIELIGKDATNIKVESLAKSIHYRAYFNMGIIGDMFELLGMPRELLELLVGLEIEKEYGPRFRPGISSIKYLPRLLLFTIRLIFFRRRIRQFLKKFDALFHNIALQLNNMKEEDEILQSTEKLMKATTNASYVLIVTILLMSIYNRLLQSMIRRYKIDIQKTEFSVSRTKISDIDVSYSLEQLNLRYRSLTENEKEIFKRKEILVESESAALKEMYNKITSFLDTFGHLSESGNDFSRPQWKEMPDIIKEMIINLGDKDNNDGNKSNLDTKVKTNKHFLLRFAYRNSHAYQEYRDRVNHIYTYGYGLFRQHFLTIASLWQKKNIIKSREDIFYLTHNEIKGFQSNLFSQDEIKQRIINRKSEMQRVRNIRLPSVIVGDSLPPEVQPREALKILHGIPTSKGYTTGKIVVISTIEDFPKMKSGRILVIPHSDIGWTPLFPSAKGIISESGGMLSHCSIIAREYDIPAVVSVPDAMKLSAGTLVGLDGDKGEVILLE